MVSELKEFIDDGRVIFGARESMRNAKKIEKVFVAMDCRQEILESLKANNLDVETLDFGKKEVADKLVLAFQCEAFGVKK